MTQRPLRPYVPAHRAARKGVGRRHRVRLLAMLLSMAVGSALIVARLVDLQAISPERYIALTHDELTRVVTLPAGRGALLDRTGQDLAISVPQETITANPIQISKSGNAIAEAAALSTVLTPVTGQSRAEIERLLSERAGFVYLARQVSDSVAAKVTALGLPGVSLTAEPKRFDPAGVLASPVLGTVNIDGTGDSGLEKEYNSVLTGTAGRLVEEVDPKGRVIAGGLRLDQPAVPGMDVVTTIDERLQYQTEQALAQSIVAAKAKSGIALVMDPKTGDLLAVVSLVMPSSTNHVVASPANELTAPTPGQSADSWPVEAPTSSAFTDVYEPGSINKLITISAALQEKVIAPSSQFTIENQMYVAGTQFSDAEQHPTENWNVTAIVANSSNIGTIQIGEVLGKDRLNKYLRAYGLGQRTSVDFPYESDGLLLSPSKWSGTSTATVAIGQGIAVTAVQMLAAYNAVANGGVYVAPRLVAGTIDSKGREHPAPAAKTHRVVSAQVAREMTTMLDEVVRVGTGVGAHIDGYTVAGKTGTAKMPSPNGGYMGPGHYFASFAGFVPSEKPALSAIVMLDDTPDFGGAYSAPTFAAIAQYGLREFKIPPPPPEAPAPGVPLVNKASATAASPSDATAPAPNPAAEVPVSTTQPASTNQSAATNQPAATTTPGSTTQAGGT